LVDPEQGPGVLLIRAKKKAPREDKKKWDLGQ